MSTSPVGGPVNKASSEREVSTPQRKGKGKMPSTSSSDRLQDTGLFDDDSTGVLSEDPAPYAGRKLINKELTAKEEFAPHDTDPTMIEATFKMIMPNGKDWFVQKDVIPEMRASAEEDLYEPGASIFFPSLDSCKVPKKDKEKKSGAVVRWNKVGNNVWERKFKGKHEVFTPSIALRRFNARTHAYERIHIAARKLNNIDPNNKKWKDAYNKWIDQISRRSNADYQKKKSRDHWSAEEICAMYAGINAFVHANGIDTYENISASDLSTIMVSINAVGGKNRGVDALRGQITSAHETKSPSMAYLRDNARDFGLYIEKGGIVSEEERFPQHFIPLAEFPVEKPPNRRKSMPTSTVYKSKFRSVSTQTGDDHVVHDDSDDAASNKSSTGSPSKKRKRGASASDSDEDAQLPSNDGYDTEDEDVEYSYDGDTGETSGEEQEDEETDVQLQHKKPRLFAPAEELARRLLEEDSDELM